MIAGLSKAITLYLAPILMLTTLFLTVFSYFSPSAMLHDRVALLTVTPSTALVQAGPARDVDGPSVFIGVLGSCSRTNEDAEIICTNSSVDPEYDLTVLPDRAPRALLTPPTASAPAFLAVSLSFSILFFISFAMISFRHKMGARIGGIMDNANAQRFSAWIGFFGFIVGITSFLIVRMWFGKAIEDFNNNIALQGEDGPQLVASTGNAFTMVWVGYAFYAVPLIVSLSKLNVKATKEV